MYRGWSVEPLAFTLKDKPIATQEKSPLCSTLPSELRQIIYEYALSDCTRSPTKSGNPYRRHDSQTKTKKRRPSSDIAINLLRSCRAVYLESYQLPLLLNPFIIYNLEATDPVTSPSLFRLAPWQFGLVQHLDISLQQFTLETDELGAYLDFWRLKERHRGAVVAPRFYKSAKSVTEHALASFNFGILQHRLPYDDGVKVTLPCKGYRFPEIKPVKPRATTARAMRARPITGLTLRLSPTDWWTWGSDPKGDARLGLHPGFNTGGVENRELPIYMYSELQVWRTFSKSGGRAETLRYKEGWGATIAKFPDLKVFELVLQTFEDKKEQLDVVAACAQTWNFQLTDQPYHLVWSETEVQSYEGEEGAFGVFSNRSRSYGCQAGKRPLFEVRVVRFKRVRLEK
ncbi:hypothetical protein BCR34DRAFT_558319 [Clohesyomyces aquaticus]|uniref:Uncharacterized protein n=1 Tax=Clohesyomyces aquaticus TaxID=1231657 RepID=A0A1Y1ZZI2_9PLEO|nr:hypothetical protein BCR34DRAFT_558319 [Clohesyomyces aquaticus]